MKKQIERLGVAIVLGLASTASAQIYTPPLALQGIPSKHLYSIPGVENNGLTTVFSCTNASAQAHIVSVEIFGPDGDVLNDASATSLILQAGATRIFATTATATFNADSLLLPGLVSGGSARVLASAATGIICTAFLTNSETAPPLSMTNLTIVEHVEPMVASVCGLGFELLLVVPPLMWLRRRYTSR